MSGRSSRSLFFFCSSVSCCLLRGMRLSLLPSAPCCSVSLHTPYPLRAVAALASSNDLATIKQRVGGKNRAFLVVAGKASIPWLVVLVIVVDSTSSQLDHERLLLEFLEQARSCPPCPPPKLRYNIRRTRPRAGYVTVSRLVET